MFSLISGVGGSLLKNAFLGTGPMAIANLAKNVAIPFGSSILSKVGSYAMNKLKDFAI